MGKSGTLQIVLSIAAAFGGRTITPPRGLFIRSRLFTCATIISTPRRRLKTGKGIVPGELRRLRRIFLITKSPVSSNPDSGECAFPSKGVEVLARTSDVFPSMRVVGKIYRVGYRALSNSVIYESRVGRWKGDGGRGMRYRELGHEAVCTLYTREEDAIVGFYLVLWPVLGINADVNDRGGRSKLSSTGHEVVLTVDLEHPWPTRGRTHRGDLPVIAKFTTGRTERGSEGGLETIQVSRFGGCWCTSSVVNVKPSSRCHHSFDAWE